jgi:FkbM family methyltransferase
VQDYTSPEQFQPLEQKQVRVAIIDIMGACYDGDTLNRRGLGGSEAAVVQAAQELSQIGFDVTVFNACDEDDCLPGVYGDVTYLPLSEIQNAKDFDVVISSRIATPFVPAYWNVEQTSVRKVPYEHFHNIQKAKIKALWMHDTFSSSDNIIEKLLVDQHVNELWTLSDFHYNYLTNNRHGSTYSDMRNYEVLRNHTWITRNGMKLPKQTRNLTDKEPYHFVFNSNRSKGLHPLLHDVWPQVKKRIPKAKLTVVGGYYKLSKAVAHDDEYEDFMNMVGDAKDDASITFTGILSLEQIYDIYAKASYLLYPTEHPETFGISTLEAQYHDMQVLTCKFGALEELAYPSHSMIDYSCTPNALKHDINRFEQAETLADLALERVKQNKKSVIRVDFEQIREIAGWDTVALEWKQHIYSKLGLYLSADESERSLYTRSQWQKLFGRRVTAPEQWVAPFSNHQRKIVVISPFYNADQFIDRCINSVASQIYNNYEHILIDDCSTETSNVALNTIANLPENIRHKFKLIKNSTNRGAVYNHINTIRDLNDDDIVILLDGDDWLANRPDIFQYYNHIHENNDFTYGSCWSVVDNIPLVSQPYPSRIKANKSYREHMFNWYAPYTHLRTFKAKLIKYEKDEVFMNKEGEWFKAGGDLATFYQAIENCDPDRVHCSSDVVYQYNDAHSNNDYKVNGEEQTKTARSIARVGAAPKEMFTVTVPTMWRCLDIFQRALIEYCNCDYVDEVIIVNNDVKLTQDWEILNHEKIVMLNQEKNIKVNPAWNLGVKLAKNDRVAIINDDVVFDMKLFEKLQGRINSFSGVHGFITGEAHFNHPLSTDYSISFMNMQHDISLFGFGMAMFLHRSNWVVIPEQFEIYYGDDFIIKTHIDRNLTPVMIYNHRFESPMAATCTDPSLAASAAESYNTESLLWQEMLNQLNQNKNVGPKKILIAIPCKNDIEADTFKSIYDLEVPEGYVTEFQYFYGYAVDQVRNLIAHWVVNGYDYLFAVDHDVTFERDTLKKLLAHDKPIVSGVYRQRSEQMSIELYDLNYRRMDISELTGGLQEIGGCGFGCVLVKKEVFSAINYPWFVYHQALDHNHTFSEDLDFCKKATSRGFKLYADSSILCKHIGQHTFEIQLPKPQEDPIRTQFRNLSKHELLPNTHFSYLKKISQEGVQPKVIYDIGACVLHWTNPAKLVWPNAQYVVFEAMNELEFLYQESGLPYVAGALLYKEDDVEIDFYQNLENPGGNSMYRENPALSPAASYLYSDNHRVVKKGMRLDTLVKMFNFPQPDLIKIDVQGAELDVLFGATEALKNCKDIILELQTEEYNIGSPKFDEVKAYLESIGFELVQGPFSSTQYDGDYHFSRSPRR